MFISNSLPSLFIVVSSGLELVTSVSKSAKSRARLGLTMGTSVDLPAPSSKCTSTSVAASG